MNNSQIKFHQTGNTIFGPEKSNGFCSVLIIEKKSGLSSGDINKDYKKDAEEVLNFLESVICDRSLQALKRLLIDKY